jgi:hypothetical protein
MTAWPSSAPPVREGLVGRVPGFWIKQAHPDEETVVIDAVDDVPVQLELGHDGGWERDPAGVQFGKRDRLIAGLAQSLEQALLLNLSGRHRPDCRPFQRDRRTSAAASKPHRWHRTLATGRC